MEATLSVPLLSQEEDTIMQGTETLGTNVTNGDVANGFMDPRDMTKTMQDLDPEEVNSLAESRDKRSISPEEVPVANARKAMLPTGCCYDDRMKLHANADFSDHPAHPEDPRRIEAIFDEFRRSGLIYTGSPLDLRDILKDNPTKYMWRISARRATEEEVCLVHNPHHWDWVMRLGETTSEILRNMTASMDLGRKSLYVGNLTHFAAQLSAGAAIETCKNVVVGTVKNAIAVIRPPGHHAESHESLGFCIFNNVPIAAAVCMKDFPETCRKVLILDWDVHHGNGIQNMFYDNPNVLYISIHVYQNGIFYPGQPEPEGSPDGGIECCGTGAGIGKNINIGWHDQGMGDAEYMAAFQKIIMPIAQEFDPDLVIVSAGFDAAAGDELGGCFVSPGCYSQMTHMLMSLANGKVAVCLEGGYNLRAISISAVAVAKTLMGEPPQRISIPPLNEEAAKVLDQVKLQQARYWECLRPGVIPIKTIESPDAVRMSEVVRSWQYTLLGTEHKMTPLYIQKEHLSEFFSYDNSVLVTSNLPLAKKVLVIIHDPPEISAHPDPLDNHIDPAQAFVIDGIKRYVDAFVANGYGVMDINVPLASDGSDDLSQTPGPSQSVIEARTKELVCYLWDNYLEAYNSNALVVLSVGEAYIGVRQLLTTRLESRHKIAGIASIIKGFLRPVRSDIDLGLAAWYKTHTLIYVDPQHSIWHDEELKRRVLKLRYGLVKESAVSGLREMLEEYADTILEWANDMMATKIAELKLEDPDLTDEDEYVEAGADAGSAAGAGVKSRVRN